MKSNPNRCACGGQLFIRRYRMRPAACECVLECEDCFTRYEGTGANRDRSYQSAMRAVERAKLQEAK